MQRYEKNLTYANIAARNVRNGVKKVRILMKMGEIGLDRCVNLEIPENLEAAQRAVAWKLSTRNGRNYEWHLNYAGQWTKHLGSNSESV